MTERKDAFEQTRWQTNSAANFAVAAKHSATAGNRSKVLFIGAVAFFAGLALRVLFLGSKGFWLDEAFSVVYAANPAKLFANGYDPAHPPLYYTLLHYWLPFGMSEFILRLSSAILGSLAILVGYAVAIYLGRRRIATTAIWLMAFSPLLVWYSQELRSYSLLLLVSLIASLALLHLVSRPNFGRWLVFAVAMSATLYTHYAAILLIAVQFGLMSVLYLQGRATRRGALLWLASWPVVLLFYWPWMVTPGMQAFLASLRTTNFYPILLLVSLLSIPLIWAKAMIALAILLAIAILLFVGFLIWKRGAKGWERWLASPFVRYGVLLLFFVLTLFSVVPRAYTLKKLLVELWPYGLLAVAWIFPWRSSNRIPLIVLLAISLIASLINVTLIPKDQWREMAAYLQAHGEPTDTIWISPSYQEVALNYYFAHLNGATTVQSSAHSFNIAHVMPAMSGSKLAALLKKDQRVWLIYHTVGSRQSDPDRRLEKWLAAHLQATDQIHFYGIDATLFSPQP